MSQQKQLDINLQDPTEAVMLLGISDKNIKLIEEELKVQLITRGELIQIAGEEQNVEDARQLIIQLLLVIRKGININLRDVTTAIEMSANGTIEYFASLYDEEIARNTKGKAIRAKTIGQREYVHGIRHTDLTFGIGPAGTGKTYLAVVMATQALKMHTLKESF